MKSFRVLTRFLKLCERQRDLNQEEEKETLAANENQRKGEHFWFWPSKGKKKLYAVDLVRGKKKQKIAKELMRRSPAISKGLRTTKFLVVKREGSGFATDFCFVSPGRVSFLESETKYHKRRWKRSRSFGKVDLS